MNHIECMCVSVRLWSSGPTKSIWRRMLKMLGLSDEGGALILNFSESWLQVGQEFMACLSECGPVWPQVLCSRKIPSLMQEGSSPF